MVQPCWDLGVLDVVGLDIVEMAMVMVLVTVIVMAMVRVRVRVVTIRAWRLCRVCSRTFFTGLSARCSSRTHVCVYIYIYRERERYR